MFCAITADPIDAAELAARVRSDADGAVLLFTGVVRNEDSGRAVSGLTYQAYEAMATAKMRSICTDVQGVFDIGDIAIVHRVGELDVGEVSVAIAVAAPHRGAAYAASRELIDRLKAEVPIWKRERYTDGEESWLDGAVPPTPKSD